MKLDRKLLLLGILFAVLSPTICTANNGLKGIGDALAEIIGIMGLSVVANLVLTIGNTTWKNKVVRVICIILLVPQLAFVLLMFNLSGNFDVMLYFAIAGLLFSLLQVFLISKSVKKVTG